MKDGIDQGFCFDYGRLSSRRKFLRTLWTGPVMLSLLMLIPEFFLSMDGGIPDRALRWSWYGFFAAMQVLFAVQLVDNYHRWRSAETRHQLA
jgi:hypothetical protein